MRLTSNRAFNVLVPQFGTSSVRLGSRKTIHLVPSSVLCGEPKDDVFRGKDPNSASPGITLDSEGPVSAFSFCQFLRFHILCTINTVISIYGTGWQSNDFFTKIGQSDKARCYYDKRRAKTKSAFRLSRKKRKCISEKTARSWKSRGY